MSRKEKAEERDEAASSALTHHNPAHPRRTRRSSPVNAIRGKHRGILSDSPGMRSGVAPQRRATHREPSVATDVLLAATRKQQRTIVPNATGRARSHHHAQPGAQSRSANSGSWCAEAPRSKAPRCQGRCALISAGSTGKTWRTSSVRCNRSAVGCSATTSVTTSRATPTWTCLRQGRSCEWYETS